MCEALGLDGLQRHVSRLRVNPLELDVAGSLDDQRVIRVDHGENAGGIEATAAGTAANRPLSDRSSRDVGPVLPTEPLEGGLGVGRIPDEIRHRLLELAQLDDQIAALEDNLLAFRAVEADLALHGEVHGGAGVEVGSDACLLDDLGPMGGDHLADADDRAGFDHLIGEELEAAVPGSAELLTLDRDAVAGAVFLGSLEGLPDPREVDDANAVHLPSTFAPRGDRGPGLLDVGAFRARLGRRVLLVPDERFAADFADEQLAAGGEGDSNRN